MVAGTLQHQALDGAVLLNLHALDGGAHVAGHLDAERVEVRRVVQFEESDTRIKPEANVLAAAAGQGGLLLREERLLLTCRHAASARLRGGRITRHAAKSVSTSMY